MVDNAKPEFEALSGYGKVKAIANGAKLVSDSPKIPNFIKKTLSDLQNEIKEIQELSEILKNPQPIADNGKKCGDAKKFRPIECYEFIYGKDYGKVK